jgi:hypothetical protein
MLPFVYISHFSFDSTSLRPQRIFSAPSAF